MKVEALARGYAGSPESLRRALREAASDPSVPRATRRELARAAERLRPPSPSDCGVVRFVVVQPTTTDGRIYRAIATETRRPDLSRLPEALEARVRTWVHETWPAVSLAGLHLGLSGPPPGPAWSGDSCELAVAAAVIPWASGLPPLDDVVATGALGSPGQLRAVTHLDAKRALVARDLPGATLVDVDHDRPATDVLDAILPTGWQDVLEARAGRSLRRQAREAREAFFRGRPEAVDEAAAVLAAQPEDPATEALARWVLGAAALHAGRSAEGLVHIDAIDALLPHWSATDAPPEALAAEEVLAWTLVALIDNGRISEAWRRGKQGLARLTEAPAGTARWRWVALQLAGSTHRAGIALDRLDEAADLLQHVSLGLARLDHQVARVLGDLAELQRRSGEPALALGTLTAARDALLDAHTGEAPTTARFLDLYEARALHALGSPSHRPPRPSPRWPELGLRLLETRSEDAESVTELLDAPDVRRSLALTWVVVSELARRPEAIAVEAAAAAVAGWSFDDAALSVHLDGLRQGDRDAFIALGRRCPY